MKKRVFVGCSKEAKGIADIVAGLLSPDFEVTIWDENVWEKSVFKLNGNFLHDLLKAPLRFDFGVLIGTPDDKVEVRGTEYLQARDNILFELGLFIGRMGLEKCAFLVDDQVKNMSDLSGIFLAKYNMSSLASEVRRIGDAFKSNTSEVLNFFPSNTLAYGYFENFVKALCSEYIRTQRFEVDGQIFEDYDFQILIPTRLSEDVGLQQEQMKGSLKAKQVQIECLGRPRPFWIDTKSMEGKKLHILDFPTTLTGINYAIRELLPVEYKAGGVEYETILARELDRFAFTLDNLIKRNHLDFVEIVRV